MAVGAIEPRTDACVTPVLTWNEAAADGDHTA